MENQLPMILEFTGSDVTEGDFKVALNKLLLYLAETIGSDGGNLFPKGFIGMWSGAINKIPAGWILCNGENGTPDLRDKFIVGAGGSYAVGSTGGAASAAVVGQTGETALTIGQIPSHSHTIVGDKGDPNGSSKTSITILGTQPNFTGYVRATTITESAGSGGSHSHSMSGSVQTLPPFYALCFIMKV